MASSDKVIRIYLRMVDEFSGNLNKPTSALESFGATATRVGATLTATVTAALVGVAAAGVKMASDLDTSMHNIQSITKQTDESLSQLSAELIELSRNQDITVDSAQNLAEGYYQIISSGIDASEAMGVLEDATMAATAGLTETSVAAEAIVGTLNAYGLEAENSGKVSDILFEVVNRGVGSFEELAGSLSNVTGMAAALDVSFEEVGAAISTMSKQGISFSEATVSMNQAMSNLLSPTKEGAELIAEMGYESGESMLKALGFAGAMEAISEHTGGSATEMQKLFSNTRSLRAALALTGDGAQMFAEDLAAMNAANGATAAAFAEQSKAFSFQWQAFRRDLEALMMDIGAKLLPILAKLLEWGGMLINWFLGLPEPVRNAIYVIGGLVAALGPLLLIVGQAIALWTSLSAAFTALPALIAGIGPALAGIAASFGGMLAAIVPLLPAIAALGVALGALWALMQDQRVKDIPKVWGENFRMLGEILGLLAEKAKVAGANFIAGFINGMKKMIGEAIKVVIDFSIRIGNAVKSALKIKSPSKVMEKLGQMTVAGFDKGIEKFGGIGVQVPALAGAGTGLRSTPSTGVSGGMDNSGGNVYIENLTVPPGTTQEQIRYIMQAIGKQAKRKGAKAIG